MATIKGSFECLGSIVKYKITDKKKDKIIARLIEYYKEHGFFGECIHQADHALIEAPSVLSDICDDIIKFKSDLD